MQIPQYIGVQGRVPQQNKPILGWQSRSLLSCVGFAYRGDAEHLYMTLSSFSRASGGF